MSQEYRRVTSEDLNEELRLVVEDHLRGVLSARQPGHCMRVGDLDTSVMIAVAKSLRENMSNAAQIHVLSRESHPDNPLLISSSKLVELRNPAAEGEQRPPLLVFVPNDLRTAAEDSFGEATFEQISITNSFQELQERLIAKLPEGLRNNVSEVLRLVRERAWRWANPISAGRFLLSILLNGNDPEIVGASLCELGLIPDFHLLDDCATVPNRLAKNLECVNRLTFSTKSERGRLLDLKLKDRIFRSKLGDYLFQIGLEDPLLWARRIVSEKALWPLSFDKWEFEDGAGYTEQLRVEVLEVGLPVILEGETDPRLKQLIGQHVLLIGKNGPNNFKIKFRTDPAPENVPAIEHFRFQVVARETGPTAFTKKKKSWVGARRDASVSFSGLSKVDWEDGWHFVRVLPCTADGDPIPIVDIQGQPIPFGGHPDGSQVLNESDPFYVVKTDDIEVDVPQRAVPKFASFSHALIHFWFKAIIDKQDSNDVVCAHRAWIESEDHLGKNDLLEFKFAGVGLVNVPVSRVLKVLEQRILASPDGPVARRLDVSPAQKVEVSDDAIEWPALPEIEEFRTIRRELFAKLRGEDGQQIVESADLSLLRDQIAAYAEHYLAVLAHGLRLTETAAPDQQPRALARLQQLLALDTAIVNLADHRGGQRSALLIGPTHPLRLLWLATWLTLAGHWLDQTRKAPSEHVTPTRDALLERLSIVNFPAATPLGSGRLLTAIDNLHPFWTVYGSSTETDPRGLMAELCTALGLAEPNIGSFTLNGRFLADRVRRYLVQHPYIHTLVLNCFNAGRGRLLADMLLELQKEPDLQDLRYNLRLFVPDPDASGIGEDLNELISPSSTLTVVEADAFATPTGNHLAPKLTFSVRDVADFRNGSSDYSAHLSVLFDVFPAQRNTAEAPRLEDESAPVHGLLQDFSVAYVEEEDFIAWHRYPRHGQATPIADNTEFPTLLAKLAETLSTAAATVATAQSGLRLRPVSTLVLEADQKALLHQIHEVSDWVFIIDKSLGIEFFDHHPASRRPEYLIDHSPDLSANSGRRVVITSRSQTEIRVLFERVLDDYGLVQYRDRAHALLGELRGLSGRLALKLVSSPTHRAEALGLAMAKMFLEYQDAFKGQAVLLLDAHLDLYRALQRNADELQDEISLRRTDLGLFDFDVSNRVLTCSLVEVKCYRVAGGLGGLSQLKQSIAEQILQSERTLRHHFDPLQFGAMDRPDRIIKTQELINLLEFYVDRARRLSLLSPEAYDEAKFFLRTMERGYELRFTRSALIFDFDKDGHEEFVEENGIEFHRIGADLIRKLMEALPSTPSDAETRPPVPPTPSLDQEGDTTMHRLVGRVPKVTRAAFIRDKRDRTVSWESLGLTHEKSSITEAVDQPRNPVVPSHPRLEPIPGPNPDVVQHPPIKSASIADHKAENVAPLNTGSGATQVLKIESSPIDLGKPLAADVLLGVTSSSPQFGIIGKMMGRSIALDLNQTHTVSLFGVQGGGKSYTLGSIIEMACLQMAGVNLLPQPLGTVVFHYSQTQDYKPEFTSMISPNTDANQVEALATEYGARPAALKDTILLVPSGKLDVRRLEYPNIEVLPLKFASNELQAGHWRFLMGAVGNQATYIRRLNQIMRSLRDDLTLNGLRTAIEQAGLPDNLKELANLRLNLAEDYIDDSARLSQLIRPGRLIIVDLRDEFVEKDEALGLFVVLLQIFADATFEGKPFNKLVVFDEAHKYIDNPDLVDGMVGVVREMRHKGTSILVASQDPPSVPVSLIELSSQIILHRLNSPAWLKHIQKANAALGNLTINQLSHLQPGEAYIWSAKSTDPAFSQQAMKIRCRPRVTMHGGETKTAVSKRG